MRPFTESLLEVPRFMNSITLWLGYANSVSLLPTGDLIHSRLWESERTRPRSADKEQLILCNITFIHETRERVNLGDILLIGAW